MQELTFSDTHTWCTQIIPFILDIRRGVLIDFIIMHWFIPVYNETYVVKLQLIVII